MTGRRQPRRGFALLAVLWLVVAIATVALEFSLRARERQAVAINLVERGQAYAMALAGLEIAGSRLARLLGRPSPGTPPSYVPDPSDPWWRADSLVSGTGAIGHATYAVYVHDATAMININAAWEDDWRAFLTGLGLEYDTADRLAQSIMDWRDTNDVARARGAERAAYIRAGHVVLPANKDFTSVPELRNVLGMTPAIYARIAPYATLGTEISGSGLDGPTSYVSVNSSPPPVLRMLHGFTDDVIAAVIGHRSSGMRFKSMDEVIQTVGSGAGAALRQQQQIEGQRAWFTATDEVLVRSVGWAPGGHTHVTLEAILKPPAHDVPGMEFFREE